MKVSVCAPVSRVESIRPMIQSIRRQTLIDWELIAVSQGPFENVHVKKITEIIQAISAEDSRVKHFHIVEKGSTRARNVAIKAAESPIIAEIDDDCEAAPDWLATMVEYFENHPDVEVFGGSVLLPSKKYRGLAVCPSIKPEEAIYDPATMNKPPSGWGWINGNISMKRAVFDKVGFYDIYLGPGSIFPAADDTDIMLRFEAAHVKMASSPRLVVYHTYGTRYGVKAVLKHLYNYTYGNGGLAAKLSLAGDARGISWMDKTKEERLSGRLRTFNPILFLRGYIGWHIFKSGYNRCIREFKVENNLLIPLIG